MVLLTWPLNKVLNSVYVILSKFSLPFTKIFLCATFARSLIDNKFWSYASVEFCLFKYVTVVILLRLYLPVICLLYL